MIVDVHTHAPHQQEPSPSEARVNTASRPDKPVVWAQGPASYLAAMQPVDRAICFNIAGDPRPGAREESRPRARQVNDDTADFVRRNGAKFIGFMTLHPYEPDALDELERARADLGLRGIKLGPNYQHFDPLCAEAMDLYRRAEELGLPLLFHTGTSPEQFAELDWAHPRHIDRVAIAHPTLRIILAHMSHPWQRDCIAVIRKHPNVYADVSALFYRPWSWYDCMRLASEWGVLRKLLFGSDFPAATPQETIDGLRAVNAIPQKTGLPPVPEDGVEQIISRDSLALLGLA
jgi:predicted TIM-barrel fold metal-dependent hydrolase